MNVGLRPLLCASSSSHSPATALAGLIATASGFAECENVIEHAGHVGGPANRHLDRVIKGIGKCEKQQASVIEVLVLEIEGGGSLGFFEHAPFHQRGRLFAFDVQAGIELHDTVVAGFRDHDKACIGRTFLFGQQPGQAVHAAVVSCIQKLLVQLARGVTGGDRAVLKK